MSDYPVTGGALNGGCWGCFIIQGFSGINGSLIQSVTRKGASVQGDS